VGRVANDEMIAGLKRTAQGIRRKRVERLGLIAGKDGKQSVSGIRKGAEGTDKQQLDSQLSKMHNWVMFGHGRVAGGS